MPRKNTTKPKLCAVPTSARRKSKLKEPPIKVPAWAKPEDRFQPLRLLTDTFTAIGFPEESIILARLSTELAPGTLGFVEDTGGKSYIGLVYQDDAGGIEITRLCDCPPWKFDAGEVKAMGEIVGLARPRPALRLVQTQAEPTADGAETRRRIDAFIEKAELLGQSDNPLEEFTKLFHEAGAICEALLRQPGGDEWPDWIPG